MSLRAPYYLLLFTLFFFSFSTPRLLPVSLPDVLDANGLPRGLFPASLVKDFSIKADGSFSAKLNDLCFSEELDQTLFFDRHINGTVSKRGVYDLYGVHMRRTFAWPTVNSIEVDPSNPNQIAFQVGMFTYRYPLFKFRTEASCAQSAEYTYGLNNHLEE